METAAQAMWLREVGCDYARGYNFAKPMNIEKFKELLKENKQYDIGSV